jgi:hypothetical protein
MSRPAVIGIAGPARAGKDTICRLIIAHIGGYRYSFADPIRAMLKAGFGIDMSDPYWIENKENVIPALGKSPRQLMQTLGTEWGREMVNKDLWLILGLNQIASTGPGMIIPDVRFQNEADWVRKHGALIHVRRDAAPVVAAHESEAGITPLEHEPVFINNSTIEGLDLLVRDWLHVA